MKRTLLFLLLSYTCALAQSTSSVDSEGFVLLNGERFFPIGIYCEGFEFLPTYTANADTLRDAGFNVMYIEHDVLENTEFSNFFDHCAEIGLYNIVGFYFTGQNPDFQTTFKDKSSVLCWAIGDDADMRFTPEELAQSHDTSHFYDDNHLTYTAVTTGIFDTDTLLADYTSISDVAAIEYYPVTDGSDWINGAYYVSDQTSNSCKNYGNSGWSILQSYRWEDSPANVWPSADQITVMTYLSLIAGARGVLYYTFKDYDNNSTINLTQPQLWNRMKRLTAEIDVLKNVLLNGTLTKLSDDIPFVDGYSSYWIYNDTLYLAAINSGNTETIQYDYLIPEGFESELIPLFDYDNTCTLSGRLFTASLEPYQVQIFKVLPTTAGDAANFYVSPSGSDENTGTFSEPFQTVQKGLTAAQNPGDTVFVREGVYYENVVFPHSGSDDNPIVITNYPGENAILDASTVPLTVSIFAKIHGQSHLVVNGLQLRNFLNREGPSIGLSIIGGAHDIKITNNDFRDFSPLDTLWGEMKGIGVFSTDNLPVYNYQICGNTFTRISCGQSEVLSENGYIYDFLVCHNEVTDAATNPIFQCAGGYDIEFVPGMWSDMYAVPENGVFRNNYIHDNTRGHGTTAFYVDGGRNMLIENNLLVNNVVGVSIGCEEIRAVKSSNITIRNNVIYDAWILFSMGNDIHAFPTRPPGGVDSVFIYNNTAVKGWRGLELEDSDVSDIFLYNNIFWQEWGEYNDPVVYSIGPDAPNLVLDYNLYDTGDDMPVRFFYQDVMYNSLEEFQTGTGNEMNGLFADPLFVQFPDSLDIAAGSPAIDAGTTLLYAPFDFTGGTRPFGSAPDIGAYEFGSVVTGTEHEPNVTEYSLLQNYPNPFNPTTTITFRIAQLGNVKIQIFDILGRLVKELVNEPKNPGSYTVIWNGRDAFGNMAASGTYFYRIISGGYVETKKMILVK